jgi:glycosyltransferase involved in cell wall biosynthesis
MSPSNGEPRVLVLRQADPDERQSQLVAELDRRSALAGDLQPQLTRGELALILANSFHPRISRWRAQAGFSSMTARRRTASVQRALDSHRGDHDVILQIQTLFAPGFDRAGVPYAVYTDNTMALTRRYHPAWAPISDRAAARWMEYEASILGEAAVVFTYSEFARRSAIEDCGCSPDSVEVVGAGANQMLDSVAEKDYAAPRALFVGFEFERKGGPVLLEAWPLVRSRIPEAELMIAGPKRPVGTLPEGVEWVGPSDRETLSTLYRSATLFVMPSLFEPWGHTFVEAMGHGLACVGTTHCAMPEIIDDGATGRLVAPGEPVPLADVLIELLSDPVKRAAMGTAAYETVSRERRWSHVADRVLARLAAELAIAPQAPGPQPQASAH